MVRLEAGEHDADGHAFYVPFPGPGDGLVEIVNVENEVAVRAFVVTKVLHVGIAAQLNMDAGSGLFGQVGAMMETLPRKKAKGEAAIRAYLSGGSFGRRPAVAFNRTSRGLIWRFSELSSPSLERLSVCLCLRPSWTGILRERKSFGRGAERAQAVLAILRDYLEASWLLG